MRGDVSLQEMLTLGNLPSKPLQLSVLRQVAVQLDQAHQRGLVHGNLTPQCIFVSQLGPGGLVSVRLNSFGTRFILDSAIPVNGVVPLNAYYLSPEQILGIDITPQSDVFSFAVIAYEMVTGQKPFVAPSVSALIFTICTDPPKPPEEVDASLTAGVGDVLNRALSKDREQRYADCGQFVTALETELTQREGWSEIQALSPAVMHAEAPSAFRTAAASGPSGPFLTSGSVPQISPQEPQTTGTWKEPTFEPRAVPADLNLPPLPRRTRFDDEDFSPTASPAKKFTIALLVLLVMAGAGIYFWNQSPHSALPAQVLDTKAAPVSPPPADDQPNAAASSQASTTQQPSAPALPAQSDRTAAPPQTTSASPQHQQPAHERTRQPAHIEPVQNNPSTSAVELLSEPPGASITVDNNPLRICRAPCTMSLPTGRHTLAARLVGYTLAQRIFNLPETTSVFVAMPKMSGTLVVTSAPAAATILVDGSDFGLTPATLHLSPGQHRITLMNGSQRHEDVVTVVADGIQATGFSFPR